MINELTLMIYGRQISAIVDNPLGISVLQAMNCSIP